MCNTFCSSICPFCVSEECSSLQLVGCQPSGTSNGHVPTQATVSEDCTECKESPKSQFFKPTPPFLFTTSHWESFRLTSGREYLFFEWIKIMIEKEFSEEGFLLVIVQNTSYFFCQYMQIQYTHPGLPLPMVVGCFFDTYEIQQIVLQPLFTVLKIYSSGMSSNFFFYQR
jgi:hypothetical protein